MKLSKVGLFFVSIYLLLAIYAIGYIIYRINFTPVNSEFAGLGIIILTLPWSILLLKAIEIPESITIYLLILSGLALLNAFIIYMIGHGLEKLLRNVFKPKQTAPIAQKADENN